MAVAADSARGRVRTGMRWVLALFYFTVGVFHLHSTATFVAIVPAWVPDPYDTVLATGCCELLGAAALLIPRLRRLAGIMLAIYAMCVVPANINQAINHIPLHGEVLGWDFHGPRLAAQPVLIWWTLFCTAVTEWPFKRRAGAVGSAVAS